MASPLTVSFPPTGIDRSRRWRVYLQRGAPLLGLVVICGLAALWLALHRIPSWYRPAQVAERELAEVRTLAMRLVDQISDQMVQGRPFEVELEQGELNRILACWDRAWPEAVTGWPREVGAPALAFEPGRMWIGGLLARGEDRAVIGVCLDPQVAAGFKALCVRLEGVRAGALPLPMFVVNRQAGPLLARLHASTAGSAEDPWLQAAAHLDHLGPLVDPGLSVENRFIWPNGKRRFRIRSIECTPGRCRIGIEPL